MSLSLFSLPSADDTFLSLFSSEDTLFFVYI